MKLAKSLVIILIFVTVFSIGCSKRGVLAKIGKTDIEVKEFKELLHEVGVVYPDFVKTKEGKKQILDSLIREKVLEQEALKRKFKEDPIIKKKLKEILVEKMLNTLKNNELIVSEGDIKKYYENNIDYYKNPREIKVAHILVPDIEEAQNLLSKIEAGEDFKKLASVHSIDNYTKNLGGELDFFGMGDMLPEFERVAFGLKNKGDVSSPFKSPVGYHIIKLLDERKGKTKEIEDIALKIKDTLSIQKFENWLENKYDEMNIKVNSKLLEEIKDSNSE